MTILPISNFRNCNVKSLNFNNTHNTVTPQSDKQVTTKDIPYSYPIAFKGRKQNMNQILADSNWAKGEFERFGIEAEIDKNDGLLTISEFKNKPDDTHSYKDLDIDVQKLLQNVKKIKGDGDFSEYENLCVPNLEVVVGDIYCTSSKNIEFTKLKSVDIIQCHKAENIKFSELTTANGIDCRNAKSIEFPKLTTAHNIDCESAQDIKFPQSTNFKSQLIFVRPCINIRNNSIQHRLVVSGKVQVLGQLSDTYRKTLMDKLELYPRDIQRKYKGVLAECKTYIQTESGKKYLVTTEDENIKAAQDAIEISHGIANITNNSGKAIKFLELK